MKSTFKLLALALSFSLASHAFGQGPVSGTAASSSRGKTFWVGASGSDTKDGSSNAPFASINRALRAMNGVGEVKIIEGDYPTMNVDGSLAYDARISGNGLVRTLGGTNISSFALVSGALYQFTYDGTVWSSNTLAGNQTPYIYEAGTDQQFQGYAERTALSYMHNFILPDFTILTNARTLAICSTANGSFFPSNNAGVFTIFVRFSDGAAPGIRTVRLPDSRATNCFVYNCKPWTQLEVSNIRTFYYYRGFDYTRAGRFKAENCIANAAWDSGFVTDDHSCGGELFFCEGSGSSNDGFDWTTGGDRTNQQAGILKYCLGRKNGDEALSCHYGGPVMGEGCLFEYNGSAAVTPYAGGRIVMTDSILRYNDLGAGIGGTPTIINSQWTNFITILELKNCQVYGNRIGVFHEDSQTNLITRAWNTYFSNTFEFFHQGAQFNGDIRLNTCSVGHSVQADGVRWETGAYYKDPTLETPLLVRSGTGNRYSSQNTAYGYVLGSLSVGVLGFYTNQLSDMLVGLPNAPSATQGRTGWLASASANVGRFVGFYDAGKTAGGAAISNLWIQCSGADTLSTGPAATNITTLGGMRWFWSDGSRWVPEQ